MDWLNYHHLLYFWTVAREGGLAPASKVLHLAKPTLSAQIRMLEDRLGEPLFLRTGRRLELSETGQVVYKYAEEIFGLGNEMLDTLKGRARGRVPRLVVGVSDVVPKYIVRRLLEPALHLPQRVRLVCHEGTYDELLAKLASHELHVVIADAPIPPGATVKAYQHLLGDCGVTIFGAKKFLKLKRGFPRSLDGAPMLLPVDGAPLRRALNGWFASEKLSPEIVGEFEDTALLKTFGTDGVGLFAGPTAVEQEITYRYDADVIGRVSSVRERFYAITAERKLIHPAVKAITDAAQSELFKS